MYKGSVGTARLLPTDHHRADLLKERLAAAEIELESNQRHVGVLKRAIRALPKGQDALEQLDKLVTEELQPLRDQLRDLKAEIEAARAQVGFEAALLFCVLLRTTRCCDDVTAVDS